MANEGSTKPTYSELEAQLAEAEEIIESERCQFRKMYDVDVSASKVIEDLGKAYDELARVRGLLQRQWISVEERLPEVDEEVLVTSGGLHFLALHRADKATGHWEMEADGTESPLTEYPHWMPLPDPSTFPQSSSLVPQGAESADIGKLDSADKSDAVCPGCHTRACNGECMRPMRFKGDTR